MLMQEMVDQGEDDGWVGVGSRVGLVKTESSEWQWWWCGLPAGLSINFKKNVNVLSK